ncbi:uncharacterized protein LOC122664479 [Telopea speciosissima]|uniref:uncharacterized protein LOC122664479 n=1 Tax=Telopea speciosissima TaxID=54955 RepID=UPI001CC6FE78|nr:uncharacterized protein LOC122664479 [Telopea speciosissima]
MGGYGAIGRDASASVVFAIAGATMDKNVLSMELMAIRQGLRTAKAMNWWPLVQVRSDSMIATQVLTGRFAAPWNVLSLVGDILDLTDWFRGCSFQHYVRETNFCADFLAGLLTSCGEVHYCNDTLPTALSTLIRDDAKGKKYYRL